MSGELVRKSTQEIDGFDGYEDATEGEEEQFSSGLIVGEKIKFDNSQVWVDRNGDELPAGLEVAVIKVLRVEQKWGSDRKPIEEYTRILEPGQKWSDLEALNAQCPQNEWREGPDGKMRGPWQGQRLVYFVDVQTMTKYTWPSPKDTVGSRICVNVDIVDRTLWKRKFRGANVYPVGELSDTFMPTRYGGRQRPHYKFKYWIKFGPDGEIQQLESSTQKVLGAKTIAPPTAKEVTGDEIQF
jgi:hypothetical protein